MTSKVHVWSRALAAAAAVVLLGTGAAACSQKDEPAAADGSSGHGSDGSSSERDTGSASSKTLAYASCMRKNGVDVQDPEPGQAPVVPDGVSSAVLDKATKACGKPQGGQDHSAGTLPHNTTLQGLEIKLSDCLRKNGWVPKPPKGNGGAAPSLNFNDPLYLQAKKACAAQEKEFMDYAKKVMDK